MKFFRRLAASALILILPVLAETTSIAARMADQDQVRVWELTLEEPTGIDRRDQEIVTVDLSFAPGEARPEQLRVIDPQGREILPQIAASNRHPDGSLQKAQLLFPASIIPGERPVYRLIADPRHVSKPPATSAITARRLGIGRVEMANDRFGVIVNLGLEGTEPALVAAFNKSAGPQRMLNLIDTTPELKETLAYGRRGAGLGTFLAPPGGTASGLPKALSRTGNLAEVEILESGPWRAGIRLRGASFGGRRETWEFSWQSGSPVLRWRASLDGAAQGAIYGYFFSSLSAAPFLPFDKWIEGVELKFPDGWETDHPPDHEIGPRDLADLPGRHVVYYQRRENYGAFGIYELDQALEWRGIGSAQFYAPATLSGSKSSTEIALAFPSWSGTTTVVDARREYRRYTQPILSIASPPQLVSRRSLPFHLDSPVSSVETRQSDQSLGQFEGQIHETSLDGEWRLNFAEKSEGEKQGYHRAGFDDRAWRAVKVPGTVHTQILEAPKFYTREAEWISSKEWWYRRHFTVPPAARGRRLRLRFDATDYYADIYLNGRLLGRHEGYIDPYEFDLTGKLNAEGENTLAVRVWTPVSYYWRHRPYTIKGSYGAVDQKPDNITAVGITRSVRLLAGGPLAIDDLAIDTRLNRDGSAEVTIDLALEAGAERAEPLRSEVRIGLSPRNFKGETGKFLRGECIVNGRTNCRYTIRVENPQLWWTWDHGRPNLYTLDLSVGVDGLLSDHSSLAVGLREIEHLDWKFYLNGKRLFIRGTNFYFHLFQSEMRRGDYERDYALMRAMNVNMIRLHCNFSNPEFYDLADEMGILIWQDFLEAWYPEDTAFSLKAAHLYDAHIKYVRNHPSVALWATSDEESLENYRDLTKHLEPRLYQHDPQRRMVQRSTGRYGDAHVYEGWYGGTIWAYARMNEKFVSELGATALPAYDSLMRFIPNAWPIRQHEDEWIFRKLQINEAMRAWGEPGEMSLAEYIPQTQAYVARLFQLAIERMRRQKYDPAGGILHFHAVDLWPSVTMAAVDFYRQPTKAYHTVQRSFQMVLPSFAYDRETWKADEMIKTELWVINDHWHEIPGTTITWQMVTAGGEVVAAGRAPGRVTLAPDSSRKLMDVDVPARRPGQYALRARVNGDRGELISENIYEFTVK